MERFLGIDIGGTSVKYGVYDKDGKSFFDGEYNNNLKNLEELFEIIDSIIENNNICGIGFSVPGFVDKKTKILSHSSAVPFLHNLNFIDIFSKRYNIPVQVENDANCAALAELWIGNGKDCDNIICLTIGTGIGGSIIINKNLYYGSHSQAGEFGLAYINTFEGVNLGYCATSMLIKRANVSNGREFFDNINNDKIKEFYIDWYKQLAKGIYSLGVIFDPSKILIGGGISNRIEIYKDIKEHLKEIALYPYYWDVAPCKFGNDSGKIGAIYNLIKERI